MSPIGDCSKGSHGQIGDWDVSGVTKMDRIFSRASAFDQDLSKWDVSAVTGMRDMFSRASVFNQDLSKWDVSAVTNMRYMFSDAFTFDQDLTNWDLSAVADTGYMFYGASASKYELCEGVWVKSDAGKSEMFTDSPGSISSTACTTARPGNGEGERGLRLGRVCTPTRSMIYNLFDTESWMAAILLVYVCLCLLI